LEVRRVMDRRTNAACIVRVSIGPCVTLSQRRRLRPLPVLAARGIVHGVQSFFAWGFLGALAASLFALAACSDDQSSSGCVASIDAACSPLYEATFDQIYTR